jgi:hypothetical protein
MPGGMQKQNFLALSGNNLTTCKSGRIQNKIDVNFGLTYESSL